MFQYLPKLKHRGLCREILFNKKQKKQKSGHSNKKTDSFYTPIPSFTTSKMGVKGSSTNPIFSTHPSPKTSVSHRCFLHCQYTQILRLSWHQGRCGSQININLYHGIGCTITEAPILSASLATFLGRCPFHFPCMLFKFCLL